jgi:hypothetical protein
MFTTMAEVSARKPLRSVQIRPMPFGTRERIRAFAPFPWMSELDCPKKWG